MLVPTGHHEDYVHRKADFARIRRNHDYIFRRSRLTDAEIESHLRDARAAGEDTTRWEGLR